MTLNELAGWVAPITTMIAAMMTAANFGARLTGWGFVVFTLGSVCWTAVGLATGQTNLIAANGFLTVVNLVGVWRWLGRQRIYEEGGESAKRASRKSQSPTLFTATGIAGMTVVDRDDANIGKAIEALIECQSGAVNYVVIASAEAGGLGETLRAVPRADIAFESDKLTLAIQRGAFEQLAPLGKGDWPASAEPTLVPTARPSPLSMERLRL